MRKIFVLIVGLFLYTTISAQQDREAYIDKYKDIAIKKMKEHGIPASITLAQGILESNAGKSTLTLKANNHFGIKCHKEWNGRTFKMDDDERNECFRKYKSAEQSFEDHSQFLTSRDRYAFLFEYDVSDYKSWAYGLKKAGYATNPNYAQLLIKVIEENHLDRFDKMKRGKNTSHTNTLVVQSNKSSKYPEFIDKTNTDFNPISVSKTNRMIYETNKVKYILALKQDSWKSIADEFDLYTKQLLDFNSASRKTPLNAGDRVYIENKKKKAKVLYHIVEQGETLQSISQIYAIRTNWIKRINNIKRKEGLKVGQRLRLR
ncbi:MAG: glucosaminidase domain-containing protein [Bacteroidales bacterium]|nr:glucosaminidase domain-containing protein [Bacteroidales bacterium]